MKKSIGGLMDYGKLMPPQPAGVAAASDSPAIETTRSADDERRTQHRPADPNALAVEMRRLAATGLRPRDIASVLGVHPMIVVRVLAECEVQS